MSFSATGVARRPATRTTLSIATRVAILAALGAAAGCTSVRPRPLDRDAILESSRAAAEQSRREVEPLSQPLSLDEAIARGLKYNLNQRALLVEQAISLNAWKAGGVDMLPRAMAMAGYHSRNKELITRSRDSVTGLPSLANPYISSDREYGNYDLGLSWSVLDFAVGYFAARQNADRFLIATEHRRKAMHALSREITVAFWRMASAQNLRDTVRQTITSAEGALADSATSANEGLRSPLETLRYQRQLLENIRLLSSIEKEFSTAQLTLANLINLPAGSALTVAEPTEEHTLAVLDLPAERLEELALTRNADLREQIYNHRIAVEETRKTLARLVPNLSLSYSLKHNNDSYLINNSWGEASALVSQNLTNLLSFPAQKRMADGGVALAEQRRLAVQAAILTQVHVARIELASTHRQLQLAHRIWNLDQDISRLTSNREEVQADSRLTRIAAQTASIVSMLRHYQAQAEFNTAAVNLQATLGLEVEVGSVDQLPLAELTAVVSSARRSWRDALPPVGAAPTASVP